MHTESGLFEQVPPYAGDPILSIIDAYLADPRADKVNLSIGYYYDESGRIPSIVALEKAFSMTSGAASAGYLPMEGDANFRAAVRDLTFGAEHEAVSQERIAVIQTVGGSGALKVGADFLRRYAGGARVYLSDPTWDNHRAIFRGAGFVVESYPYYDRGRNAVGFEKMREAMMAMPAGSIVLLHACCHNPTGADLSGEQWKVVVDIVRDRQLIAFMDMAYQGFGAGLDEDAQPIRIMARAAVALLVSTSMSKIFSAYEERCGALAVVCPSAEQADRVLGQLKFTVRCNYSSPPAHGALAIATVLRDAQLCQAWKDDLGKMRMRIRKMRGLLRSALAKLRPDVDFSHLESQRGLFCYTGLSELQVDRLRAEHAVYLVGSGRLCVAGLRETNVGRVAEAIASVLPR